MSVLAFRTLRNRIGLPMQTSNVVIFGPLCHVNDEVTDLAIEVILIDVPGCSTTAFNVDV